MMIGHKRTRYETVWIQLAALLVVGCQSTLLATESLQTRSGEDSSGSVEEAWEGFCESLIKSGQLVGAITKAEDEIDRLEGYRLMTRTLGIAFDRMIEHANGNPVAFFELQGPKRKYAGDNPDQRYHTIPIDGHGTYRIRGHRGNALLIELGAYGGDTSFDDRRTDGGGSRRLVAYLDERSIDFASDGSFEVMVGPNVTSRTGMQVDTDASSVLVRSYFEDPRDKRIDLEIERIDVTGPSPPLTATRLATGLQQAANFVDTTIRVWGGWTDAVARDATNVLVPMPDHGDILTPAGIGYQHGYWKLGPDEALIIEFEKIDAPYWGFVIMNRWMESMEWRDRTVSLNNHQVAVGNDGRVRLIVAHRDPGLPNWIDTAGHLHGLMSTRFARLDGDLPKTTVDVVEFDSLRSADHAPYSEPKSVVFETERGIAKR